MIKCSIIGCDTYLEKVHGDLCLDCFEEKHSKLSQMQAKLNSYSKTPEIEYSNDIKVDCDYDPMLDF